MVFSRFQTMNPTVQENERLNIVRHFAAEHATPYHTLLDDRGMETIQKYADVCIQKERRLAELRDLIKRRGGAKPEESGEMETLQTWVNKFRNKEERYLTTFNSVIADFKPASKSKNSAPYFSMKKFKEQVKNHPQIEQEGEKFFEEWFNYTLARYNEIQKTARRDDSILIMGNPSLDICCFRSVLNDELALSELICTPNHFNFNLSQSQRDSISRSFNQRPTMTDEQKRAVFACVGTPHYLSLMEGWAGAGKSYSSDCIKEIYMAANYQCIGVALSYMAMDVLQNETGMQCMVLAALLMKIKGAGAQNIFKCPTLLIIDEAGLVGTMDLKLILEHARNSPYPVKVVLSGDPTQLLPIGDSGALEYVKYLLPADAKCTIETIFRQNCESHRQAVKMMQAGYSGMAFYIYWQQQMLKFCENKDAMLEKITHDYLASVKASPDDSRLIIGLNREIIRSLNIKIREQFKKMGKIDTSTRDVEFQVFRNNGAKVMLPFAVGEKVMFLKNDHKIKLCKIGTAGTSNPVHYNSSIKNNMLGRVVSITKRGRDGEDLGYDFKIHVDFDDGNNGSQSAEVIINSKQYQKEMGNSNAYGGIKTPVSAFALDHAYAVTNYSSQGQTVNHLFCIDGGEMHNRYAYVSASRHKDAMTIYFNKEDLFNRMVKAKKYQNPAEAAQYATVIDLLNFIGQSWNQPNEAPTLFTHYGNVWGMLSLAKDYLVANKQLSPDYDMTDFNYDNNLLSIYHSLQQSQRTHRIRLGELTIPPKQWDGKGFEIYDSPSYFRPNDKSLDLSSLSHQNTEENQGFSIESDLNDLSHVKTLEKRSYNLSHILDRDKFLKMWGKYFDIARGGELCFISRVGDNVLSKYNLFGEDLLGVGYPFVVHGENPANGTVQKNVLILQDINYLLEFMDYYYFNPKDGVEPPILIWGAKDCDYSYILPMLDNKTITFFGDDQFKAKSFYALFNKHQDINIKVGLMDFQKEILEEFNIPKPLNMDNITFFYNAFADYFHEGESPAAYTVNEKIPHSFVNETGVLEKGFLKEILVSHHILTEAAWDKYVEPYYPKPEEISVLPEPAPIAMRRP